MTTQDQAEPEQLSYELREISADCTADLAKVSALHMELLGFGPIAGLGERFIREFGYRVHLRDGTLRVTLCEVNGEPAGFIAYTSQSMGFHRSSLRKHFFRAAWVILVAILSDPSMVRRLGSAIHVVRSRSSEHRHYADPLGEIVSIAVQPRFLTPRMAGRLGCRLSEELLVHAARSLHHEGVRSLRGIIDSDNRAPLLFYRQLGARLEPYDDDQRPQMQVWLDDLSAFLTSRSATGGTGGRSAG